MDLTRLTNWNQSKLWIRNYQETAHLIIKKNIEANESQLSTNRAKNKKSKSPTTIELDWAPLVSCEPVEGLSGVGVN